MQRLVLGSFLMCGALAAGCGSDPGAIAVSWRIGLSDDCAGADIATVEITLEDEDGGELGPFPADCTAGEGGNTFLIEDVDEGRYSITLAGFDAGGTKTYTGVSTGRTSVTEGKTATAAEITMTPAKAELTIQWRFENGLGCAAQEGAPDTVEVLLFKSNSPVATEPVDCDLSQIVIGDLEADDNYDVEATARNGATPLFRFEILDIVLTDGQQGRPDPGVFVACEAAGCD